MVTKLFTFYASLSERLYEGRFATYENSNDYIIIFIIIISDISLIHWSQYLHSIVFTKKL